MANSDCKNILNLIPLYIDNMLSDEENDIVSRHLDSCKNCQKEFDFIKSMMATLTDVPKVELPQDFHQNLMAKVRNAALIKIKKRYLMLRRIGAGVAAAAVVALSVVTFTDLSPAKNAQNTDQYTVPKLSESSVSLTAPNSTKDKSSTTKNDFFADDNAMKRQVEESKVVRENHSNGKDINVAKVSEEAIPAELSIETEAVRYTIATVMVKDDEHSELLEKLANYKKDDIGYIVPNIDALLEELKESGTDIEITTSDKISQNYIVLK